MNRTELARKRLSELKAEASELKALCANIKTHVRKFNAKLRAYDSLTDGDSYELDLDGILEMLTDEIEIHIP